MNSTVLTMEASPMDKPLDPARRRRKRLVRYGTAACVVLAVSLFLALRDRGPKVQIDRETVTMATVRKGVFQDYIAVLGNVEPIQTVYLDATEGGRIEEIFIREGTMVKKGDPILRLTNENLVLQISNYEAEVARAINDLKSMQLTLENQQYANQTQLIDLEHDLVKLERDVANNEKLFKSNAVTHDDYCLTKEHYDRKQKLRDMLRKKIATDSVTFADRIAAGKEMIESMQRNLAVNRERLSLLVVRAPTNGELATLIPELGQVLFADLLLDRAEKLALFARANWGPVITDKLPKAEQDAIRRQRRMALRADGNVVEIGYRAEPFDKVFTAASFLQRARLAKNPQFGQKWFDVANEIYEKEYRAENNTGFWKDYSAGNFGKVGAYNMMRLAPGEEKFHAELQLYCVSFTQYHATPGGLRLREWSAHEYGSLRHANNAAVIALYYSGYVESAPPLKGNTSWKGGKSNAELKELFAREAQRQVDYALGANPYQRSYLVGFGNEPFNHVHHRGAYGAWAGFARFIKGKADDRTTSRHVLYGALVAGPDHNDVFLCGKDRRPWLALPDGKGHDFFYKFPNRADAVCKTGYRWDAADQPQQDVMDSQFNEVALDYNAGFTASLA